MNRLMLIATMALVLVGCGATPRPVAVEPTNGTYRGVQGHNDGPITVQPNDSVLSAISRNTDCDALQDMFDAYADAHENSDVLAEMKRFTEYMEAADDRMRAVGCY